MTTSATSRRKIPPFSASTLARLNENTKEFKLKQHNVTVGDKAEDYAVIQTNAHSATGVDENSKEAKEKKQKERDMYRRIMDDLLRDLDEKIADANDELDAIDEAEALYKAGELDLDKPEHIEILNKAGISSEDVEQKGLKAFEKRRDAVKENINDLEKNREKVQDLEERRRATPDNQDIHQEIDNLMKDSQGQRDLAMSLKTNADIKEATGIDLGDEEFSFSDTTISAASEISSEGQISQETSKTAFNAAAAGTETVSIENTPTQNNEFSLGSPS